MKEGSSPPVRVLKVGGSLFDWPELPRGLAAFVEAQPPAINVLVAGGGELADVIRRTDARLGLGEKAAHWLCIEALGITAQMLAKLLDAPLVRSLVELRTGLAQASPVTRVFDPREFLVRDEPHQPGMPLPHTWATTSDSIAARLARVLQAEELVLLKSADPLLPSTIEDLAAAGYVDCHFPAAVSDGTFRVRMVNLRMFKHP
jgi:5-(aminomethyl)-3-furanmethanol phosphate kinase